MCTLGTAALKHKWDAHKQQHMVHLDSEKDIDGVASRTVRDSEGFWGRWAWPAAVMVSGSLAPLENGWICPLSWHNHSIRNVIGPLTPLKNSSY